MKDELLDIYDENNTPLEIQEIKFTKLEELKKDLKSNPARYVPRKEWLEISDLIELKLK
jgi:hypothetical protein